MFFKLQRVSIHHISIVSHQSDNELGEEYVLASGPGTILRCYKEGNLYSVKFNLNTVDSHPLLKNYISKHITQIMDDREVDAMERDHSAQMIILDKEIDYNCMSSFNLSAIFTQTNKLP